MSKLWGWTIAGLAVVVLSSSASLAQQSDLPGRNSHIVRTGKSSAMGSVGPMSEVQGIDTADDGSGMRVEIRITPAVRPKVTEITDPDRLVLDFASTTSVSPHSRFEVNRHGVRSVRIGVQPGEPPATRVVVDLVQQRSYDLALGANTVTLKLGHVLSSSEAADSESRTQPPPATSENTATDSSPAPAPATDQPESSVNTSVAAATANPPSTTEQSATPPADPPSATGSGVTSKEENAAAGSLQASAAGAGPSKTDASEPAPQKIATPPAVSGGDLATNETNPAPLTAMNVLSLVLPPPREAVPASVPMQVPTSGTNSGTDPTASSQRFVSAPGKPSDAYEQVVATTDGETAPPEPAPHAIDLAPAPVIAPPLNTGDLSKTGNAIPQQLNPNEYVIGERDELAIVIWKEPELSSTVVVRPDGKITVPLINELKVVGMTPLQLQTLLTERLKPFLNVPQVTVIVRQINSRNVYLIGEVGREGMFPINNSTTVLQLIAEAGGLKDFAKRKGIYVLRKEHGQQVRHNFNYNEVIRGKNSQQNIILQPGDTVVVP